MPRHSERHRIGASAWLRAAVLGANDGVVSIASLVLGVAAAEVAPALAALAGLGAWSARLGGAPVLRGVRRVVLGGALAMALTAAIGALVGTWIG